MEHVSNPKPVILWFFWGSQTHFLVFFFLGLLRTNTQPIKKLQKVKIQMKPNKTWEEQTKNEKIGYLFIYIFQSKDLVLSRLKSQWVYFTIQR